MKVKKKTNKKNIFFLSKSKNFAILIMLLGLMSFWNPYFSHQTISAKAKNYFRNLSKSDPLPLDLFVHLAKAVNPAVVNIVTTEAMQKRLSPGREPFFDLFEQFMGPIPQHRPRQGMGSGFIIRKDGLILTNNHVVTGRNTLIKVQLNKDVDEKTYEAQLVGRDSRTDIALIKINTKKSLPTIPLGQSKKLEVGEWVAAFGNPFGQSNTLTVGIVSFIGRKINDLNKLPFIQTDASINPGNSGGPLVNIHGEAIGVNTAIDARAQGIGFAIAIDDVKTLIPILEKNGEVVRGFLGVYMQDITLHGAQSLGLENAQGTLIAQVAKGSPANKADIKPYDFIIKFGEHVIKNSRDLSHAVQDTPVDERTKIEFIREGKKMSKNVKLVPHPDHAPLNRNRKSYQGQKAPFNLGFKISNWSFELKKEFDLPTIGRHPVVIEITPGSPASAAGLNVGDVILDVNKKPVRKATDVLRHLQNNKANLLRVQRHHRVHLIMLPKN